MIQLKIRKYISAAYLIAGMGLASSCQTKSPETTTAAKNGVKTITILQTADIHGQLMPHQEFFIENGELVFKERGGVANIQTIFNRVKAENPNGTVAPKVDGCANSLDLPAPVLSQLPNIDYVLW